MIQRMWVNQIRPSWSIVTADRYESHVDMSFALIQFKDEPDYIYVVQDQAVPFSMENAREMIEKWREANAGEEA
jgi:hypothetical protein